MKVKPVKLVSQDGDDMLSAMTLTHTGDKEELRTLGCNGGSGLQDRSPVRSLLSATSMVTRLLTSFMPHARQSWGGPCPAKPTGSSNSMPSPADLQDRERQKTFLVGMESIAFLTMATGCTDSLLSELREALVHCKCLGLNSRQTQVLCFAVVAQ